jgi:hypothetical protein
MKLDRNTKGRGKYGLILQRRLVEVIDSADVRRAIALA